MTKKIRLRVGNGVEWTSTLLARLAERFACSQDDIEVESCASSDNLYRSYSRRQQALLDAFRYIMDAMPSRVCSREMLEKYLAWCNEEYVFPMQADTPIETYQSILESYTVSLINALVDFWTIGKNKAERKLEAIALLNKAEQYDLVCKGREDLATISLLNGERGTIILQWEQQLPACSDDTLAELEAIRNNAMIHTPDWFRGLPAVQRMYLHASGAHLQTSTDLAKSVLLLQSVWKRIRSVQTPERLCYDLNHMDTDGEPDWFKKLAPADKSLLRQLSAGVYNRGGLDLVDIELKRMEALAVTMSDAQYRDLDGLRGVSFWFVSLPNYEQSFLKRLLSRSGNVADVVSFLPSRLRGIPALPNFCESNTVLLTADGLEIDRYSPQLRYAHVGSREVLKQPKAIVELHTDRNVRHIADAAKKAGKQAVLYQTLVSPASELRGQIPDYELDQERIRGVARVRKTEPDLIVHTSNHPFNLYRYWRYTETSDRDCQALLQHAKSKLSQEAIRQRVQALALCAEKSEQLVNLISKCVAFIDRCPNREAFSLLLQQGKRLAELFADGPEPDFDTRRELIRAAWADSQALLNSASSLSGRSTPVSAAERARMALTGFFMAHRATLNDLDRDDVLLTTWYLSRFGDNEATNTIANTLARDITDLARLSRDYQNLLGSPTLSATCLDYYGREMSLAGLESLLAHAMHDMIATGSCISGKDRRPLALMHASAMWLYHHRYGTWPSYFDRGEARARFVDILSDLYLTRQAHEHAGQNAPGADGIKHPHNYFPADVVEAIKRKAGDDVLVRHDRLASNNEVKDIFSREKGVIGSLKLFFSDAYDQIKPGQASCTLAALKLDADSRLGLLGQLKIINSETRFWQSRRSYTLPFFGSDRGPDGVDSFKTIGNRAGTSPINVLAAIYMGVLSRPQKYWPRDDDTQDYYAQLKSLIQADDPQLLLPQVMIHLEILKKMAFEFNSSLEPSC